MAVKLDLLTKEEIAERFLVDVRTITNWVAEGMPERMRSGRPAFDWSACLPWYTQHIRDDERAKRHAGGDPDKAARLAEAKLRTALNEADQSDIDIARARGEVVPLAFMVAEFQRIGSRIRTKLVQLPTSWATRLGVCTSYTDRRLVLLEAVNELMPELQQLAGDEAVAQIAEPELPTSEVA